MRGVVGAGRGGAGGHEPFGSAPGPVALVTLRHVHLPGWTGPPGTDRGPVAGIGLCRHRRKEVAPGPGGPRLLRRTARPAGDGRVSNRSDAQVLEDGRRYDVPARGAGDG